MGDDLIAIIEVVGAMVMHIVHGRLRNRGEINGDKKLFVKVLC